MTPPPSLLPQVAGVISRLLDTVVERAAAAAKQRRQQQKDAERRGCC